MYVTYYWEKKPIWAPVSRTERNPSLTFSVGLKVTVDRWRRDVTHAARAVTRRRRAAFPGRQSSRESWEVEVVRTRTHGNVVVLGAVSQSGVERRGGGAGVHRYVVVFRVSAVWAIKWRFFSLPKDVRNETQTRFTMQEIHWLGFNAK